MSLCSKRCEVSSVGRTTWFFFSWGLPGNARPALRRDMWHVCCHRCDISPLATSLCSRLTLLMDGWVFTEVNDWHMLDIFNIEKDMFAAFLVFDGRDQSVRSNSGCLVHLRLPTQLWYMQHYIIVFSDLGLVGAQFPKMTGVSPLFAVFVPFWVFTQKN